MRDKSTRYVDLIPTNRSAFRDGCALVERFAAQPMTTAVEAFLRGKVIQKRHNHRRPAAKMEGDGGGERVEAVLEAFSEEGTFDN